MLTLEVTKLGLKEVKWLAQSLTAGKGWSLDLLSRSVSSSNSPCSALWHPRNSFSFVFHIISELNSTKMHKSVKGSTVTKVP